MNRNKNDYLTCLNIFNFQRSGEHDIDIIDTLYLFKPVPCVPTAHVGRVYARTRVGTILSSITTVARKRRGVGTRVLTRPNPAWDLGKKRLARWRLSKRKCYLFRDIM